jgi:hypothetical protein
MWIGVVYTVLKKTFYSFYAFISHFTLIAVNYYTYLTITYYIPNWLKSARTGRGTDIVPF